MRYIRYKNRKNVDELIQPILNLDIVTKYTNEMELSGKRDNSMLFPNVPL
jgi:hypothetical protein